MTNQLGNYQVPLYANEALLSLEAALGMGARVYRGYEEEWKAFQKGDTVKIRRPGTFTVLDEPSAASQDMLPTNTDITLSYHKGVRVELTDRDATTSDKRILAEHVPNMAYAMAEFLDTTLAYDAAIRIPWKYTLNAAPGSQITDITGPYQVLFDNKAPMNDGQLYYMIDGTMQQNLQANPAYSQWSGAGERGVQTQITGTVGQKFGFGFFANQNRQSYASGGDADVAGAVNGAVLKDATSIVVDGFTGSAAFKKGDILQIAGHAQQYVLTANVTLSTGAGTFSVYPKVIQGGIADNAVITMLTGAAAATRKMNLAFHQRFCSLVVAPLSSQGDGLGNRQFVATNAKSALSMRATVWYDSHAKKLFFGLDMLFGFEVTEPNLAVRCEY